MIKILQVFALTDRCGAESLVMTHYRHMNRDRFHFDFVNHTQRKCDFDDEITQLGGVLYHLPKFKLWNVLSYLNAWDKLLCAHPDYDVIHIHYFTLAGLILPIAKRHGIKVRIAHSHITKKSSRIKGILFSILRRRMINASTLLLACGKEAGFNMFKTNNFIVFNNAIESENYRYNPEVRAKIREGFHFTRNNIVIGNVGSFRSTQKNHDFIIDIFAKLVKQYPKFRLILIGEGELRSLVEEKANSLAISEYVTFTGVRSDVPNLYQCMDIFFLPSLYEGLPIVAIEAQTAGLPTIMSTEVSKETIISDLVQAIDLKADKQTWIKAIEAASIREVNRADYKNAAINNNYDVEENIKVLESIYEGKYKS